MLLACHKKSYLICVDFWIFQILRNIYLFSSSCLCPVACLSFVHWKKIKIINITYYSKIRHLSNSFSYYMPRRHLSSKKRKDMKIKTLFQKEHQAIVGWLMVVKPFDPSLVERLKEVFSHLWWFMASLKTKWNIITV